MNPPNESRPFSNIPDNIRNTFIIDSKYARKRTLIRTLASQPNITLPSEDEKENIPQIDDVPCTSLYYSLIPSSIQSDSSSYLINIMHSPETTHFATDLVANIRAADGALFIVDCIEGASLQSESALRYTVAQGITPALIISSIHKSFLKFQEDGESLYESLVNTIDDLNLIISFHRGAQDHRSLLFAPDQGNVAFSYGKEFSGSFTLSKFSSLYSKKFNIDPDKLTRLLWGNNYYDPDTKTWTTEQRNETGKTLERGFVKFLVKPLHQLIKCTLDSNQEKLDQILSIIQVTLSLQEKQLKGELLLNTILSKWLSTADSILEMIVLHLPSPKAAQKYRIRTFYERSGDDACFEGIKDCDPKGPLVMSICKVLSTSQKGRFFIIARIFSGTVTRGQKVKILGENPQPLKKGDIAIEEIQRVLLVKNGHLQPVSNLSCGNIAVLEGIEKYVMNTATIINSDDQHSVNLRHFKYPTSPIIQVTGQPRYPGDLRKFLEGLRQLGALDPAVSVIYEETGEYTIAGLDEPHLRNSLERLELKLATCEIAFSKPSVIYKETVTENSPVCLSKTPNRHNRLFCRAEPLSEYLTDLLEKRDIEQNNNYNDRTNLVCQGLGWDLDYAHRIWAFGPDKVGPNLLIEQVEGTKYAHEIKDSAVAAFQWVTREGVLCEENMRQIRINIVEVTLHTMSTGRSGLIPAMRRCCYACELTGGPRLQEPMFLSRIVIPREDVSKVSDYIAYRRGVVIEEETLGFDEDNLTQMLFYLPAEESIGFDVVEKYVTRKDEIVLEQVFDHWETINEDPLDVESRANEIVVSIRKRKGLREGIPALDNYLDRL